MLSNLKRNWWLAVVIAQATLGLLAAGSSAWGLVADTAPEHAEFRVMSIIISVVTSAVLVAGLSILGRNRRAGSWMIVVASFATLLTLLALNPIAPLALVTIVGGFWTGNLALARQPAGIDSILPDGRRTPARGGSWYRWLIAAALLFALGLVAPAAFEGTTNEVVEGLMWLTWILSWASATATAAIGVTLGITRLLARHRTRPA